MSFPRFDPNTEAILLTRLPDNQAIGVRGYLRQMTVQQQMDYVDVGDPYSPFKIPTEFRVDVNVDMLALQTVLVDLGDIWTPDGPVPLPQPRLGEGRD